MPVSQLRRALGDHDCIVIGSDQIWNYDYGLGSWHFADFAESGRAVPLAPSVGHDHIPDEWLRFYTRWLSRFEEVGTRELRWTDSLDSTSGLPKFTEVIDPTLVLSRKEWDRIAEPVDFARDKLLVYSLGGLLPEHDTFANEVARWNDLERLEVSGVAKGIPWETDAAQFLGMISASAGVITDSYHGAIFAFLFDKPLALIPRRGFAGAMNSRIDTLMRNLDLSERLITALSPATMLTHDYAAGRVTLKELRRDFWRYLERRGLARLNGED